MEVQDAIGQAYKNGYEAGYADGEIDFAPKWIPVTKRLPTAEDEDKTGCVLAIEILDGFARCWEASGIRKYPEMYTHRMSVPKPPKGE